MKIYKAGAGKGKLGMWGLLASGLVLGATVLSSGASTPIKDAKQYACTDTCYFNFRTCLMAGNPVGQCQTQYSNCAAQCSYSGARAGGNDMSN